MTATHYSALEAVKRGDSASVRGYRLDASQGALGDLIWEKTW